MLKILIQKTTHKFGEDIYNILAQDYIQNIPRSFANR